MIPCMHANDLWARDRKRRKLKIAGALAFASALLGLAAFGSFGERGVDPTKPGGWQEQQVHFPVYFTTLPHPMWCTIEYRCDIRAHSMEWPTALLVLARIKLQRNVKNFY